MKRLLTALFCVSLLTATVSLPVACSSTQQQRTYKTIYTVQQTTTAAVDAYFYQVATGNIPTNGVPAVAKAYNTFQGGTLVALDIAQWDTNAVAPSSLQTLSLDLLNLIAQFSKK